MRVPRPISLEAIALSTDADEGLKAESTHLDAGLVHEKALYYSTFSTHDCQEGLAAFLEKREPVFEHC